MSAALAKQVVKKAIKEALVTGSGVVGGTIGGAYGGLPGTYLGAAAGMMAGSRLSRIIGSGDYESNFEEVSQNSLAKKVSSASAAFGRTETMRMRNREFIQNVVSDGSTFALTPVSINPGLAASMPLLANIAANFVKYKAHGIVIEYVSLVSSYTATAPMGAVVLSAQYNASSPAFTNKVAMENTAHAISAKPSSNIVYGVECKNSLTPYNEYFVRTGDTPSTSDILEDLCTVYLALAGLSSATYPAGTVIGEMWITYDIELLEPRYPNLLSGFANNTKTNCSSAAPLGSPLRVNRLGVLSGLESTSTAIRFGSAPLGDVIDFTIIWKQAVNIAAVAGALTPNSGCAFYSYLDQPSSGTLLVMNTAASNGYLVITGAIQVIGTNPTLTLSGFTLSTPTDVQIICNSLGQGISFTSSSSL